MTKLTTIVTVAVAVVMWSGCASNEQATQNNRQPKTTATGGDTKPFAQSESLQSTTTSVPANVPAYTVDDEELCDTYASGGWIGKCVWVQSEAVTKADLATIADHIRSTNAAESRAESMEPADRIQIWFYVPGYTPEQTGYAETFWGEKALKSVYFGNTTEEFIAQMKEMNYMRVWTKDELANQDSPPQETTTDNSSDDLVAEAETAARDYYRAASSQDWDYTYDNLDSVTQSGITREEWTQKNQWFADQGETIYAVESVELDETAQEPLAEVSVRLTDEGGSSTRTTYFVNEYGEWKHRFDSGERDLFKPGLSFDRWVGDMESATPDGTEQYQTVPSTKQLFPEDTNGDGGEGI